MFDQVGDKNISSKVQPEILGKILFLQSVVHSLPTNKGIAEFLCEGLTKIELINFAAIRIEDGIYSSDKVVLDEISLKKDYKTILINSELDSTKDFSLEIQTRSNECIICLQTSSKIFGYIVLVSGNNYFLNLYKPFLESLANTIALNIENREKEVSLKKLNTQLLNEKGNLESRVAERTEELSRINIKLRNEIAERKQIERALRESEERWQFALEGAEDGVWDWDTKNDTVYFSPQWKSMLGHDENEIKNDFEEWDKRIHHDDRDQVFEILNKHLEGKSDIYSNEHRLLCKDGTYKWILDRGKVIKRDVNGKPLRVIGTHTDISELKTAEESLKKNAERFNQVAACANTWVWEVDKNGMYTYVSLTSEQLLGYKPEEIIGKKYFYDFFVPEIKEDVKRTALEIFERKESFAGFENLNLKKDGSIVILETTGVPVLDNDGNLIGYRGTDRDITEKKRISDSIRQQKEEFETIFNLVKTQIWYKDAHNNFLRINDQVCIDTGYKREEIEGHSAEELFPEFAEKFYKDDLEVLKSTSPKLGIIDQINTASGELIWLKSDKLPVFGKNNEVIGLLLFSLDITKQKLAEDKLKISEQKHRAIFNSTSEAIFIHDAETGKILDVNETMLRMYNYDRKEEVLKGSINISFDEKGPHTKEKAFEKIMLAISDGPQVFEWLARRKNGERFWVEISLKYVEIGNEKRVIAVVRDITERKKIKEALEDSQSALIEAQKVAHVGNWEFNILTEKSIWSEEMFSIFGRDPRVGALSWLDHREIIHRDDWPRVKSAVQNAIKNKTPYSLEFRILYPDGNIRWGWTIGKVASNEDGVITRIYGTVQDITERKKNIEALNASKERWESLFNNSPNAIAIYKAVENGKDFEFSDFNETAERTDNVKKSEIIGKRLSEKFPSVEELGFLDIFRRVWRTGKTEFMKDTDYKDNRIHGWRENIIYKLNTGEIVAIYNDISDRKRAEEELRNSEEKFRNIFENHVAVKLLLDAETGDIADANIAAERYYGWTREELRQMNISDLNILSKEELKEGLKKASTKQNAHYEFKHKLKSGEIRDVEAYGSNVIISGKSFIHDIVHDITEKKKAEEEMLKEKERAEVADKMKTEFLAQMSHEIRSPLNAVLSLSSLLREEISKFDFEDSDIYFSGIESASKRIIRTVDSILNMSDLQLGTYQGTKRKFDIVELLQNIRKEFESLAADKQIDLRVKSSVKKKTIEVDDYAFSQIIANLVDNAIKYTKEGFIEINLIVKDKIKIEVKDSGIGISEEYLPHIFSPFSQEEQGYTRRYEGNGLGLALVKKYCDIINADISVKSKKNVGTTFKLTLKN